MTAKVPSLGLIGHALFAHDPHGPTSPQPIHPADSGPVSPALSKQPSTINTAAAATDHPTVSTSGLHSLSSPRSPTLATAGIRSELALKGWDVIPSAFIPTLSTHPLPSCLENVPALSEPVFWNHSRGNSSRFEHWDVNVRSFQSPSPRHALACIRHVLVDEGLSGNHATLHINGFADHRRSAENPSSAGTTLLRSPLSLSRSLSSISGISSPEPVKFHVAVDISKFVANRPTCLFIPSFESVEHLLEHTRSITVLKTPPGLDLKAHPDHHGANISLHALAEELSKQCDLLGFKHQVRVSVEMQHAVTHLTINPAAASDRDSNSSGGHHFHLADGVKTFAKEFTTSLGDLLHHALGGHDFRWEKGDLVARCSWIPEVELSEIVSHVMQHAQSAITNCVQLEAEGSLR